MKDFELIPAIDILDGKCVRLTQGNYENVEKFSDNPLDIAKKWLDCGVSRLHLVDLNGAKEGKPVNKEVISSIVRNTKAKVQIGGGIRSLDNIKEYLGIGVSYTILGTRAFQDKGFLNSSIDLFADKIIVGLDLKDKKIALSGWLEASDLGLDELKDYLSKVKQIVFTDVSKDGMLNGPNLNSVKEIATLLKSEIIVSGGIASVQNLIDLINLKKNGYGNISGTILGKSLYKETINLKNAVQVVEKELNLN